MKLKLLTIILFLATQNSVKCGQYIETDGITYYVSHPYVLDWYQSFRYCAAMGMYLVDIRTEAEHDRIMHVVRTYKENSNITEQLSYWTSGTDLGSEGQFYWMTTGQSIIYQNWNSGNPDNSKNQLGEVENCLLMPSSWDYKWNDGQCSWKINFICRNRFDATRYIHHGCPILNST